MTDDDLHEFDLDAWEAPPPAPGLADAVIARARDGATAAPEPEAPRSRRWWLAAIAGVAVAGAAATTLVMLGGKHAAPATGSVAAARAQHLDLDNASAELDTGADVRWSREGRTLVVEQARGNATWRVADDQLRIDTGNGIQIDATGASLRVEVHMNLSDARVVGASTLAAAAVAFVTVVVYEGHCTVHSAGQMVTVEPGATVEVHPGQPPGPPPPTVAGDPAQVDRLQKRVDELEQQLATLHDVKPGALPPAPPAPPGPTRLPSSDHDLMPTNDGCDEVYCVLKNYEDACCAKFHHASSDTLDRAAISTAMKAISSHISACAEHSPGSGLVKAHFKVAADGSVTSVEITQTPTPELGACVAGVGRTAKFPATKAGGSFSYPFMIAAADPFASPHGTKTTAPGSCDADTLEDQARNDEAIGQHATALGKMEKAIACKPTDRRYALAFMSACNAGMRGKARQYYTKVPQQNRGTLQQMCVRNGISEAYLRGDDSEVGFLVLQTRPSGATILLDGADTGLVTPLTGKQMPVEPGKHKITFMIGRDRYTYPVTVNAGESATVSKDLQ